MREQTCTPIAKIGQRLRMPETTVKTRFHRARTRFREVLALNTRAVPSSVTLLTQSTSHRSFRAQDGWALAPFLSPAPR